MTAQERRASRLAGLILLALPGVVLYAQSPVSKPAADSWYFAVSGDSRDCGDLVMPRIAAALAASRAKAPAAFYWHLGDFRRMYEPDCDVLKASDPNADCSARRKPGPLGSPMMDRYLKIAWDDFVKRQIAPFGSTPVFLGIGNHELYSSRTRDDFRRRFQRWLTQEPIHSQRELDYPAGGAEGDTYYHFVHRGVDFVSLDNASGSFDAPQVAWLAGVLRSDSMKPELSTIVIGMHEALPGSSSRGHAMDGRCDGVCSGRAVYDLLAQASSGKRVYVFASHSHRFAADVYDQPDHAGRVLPGWIIGTAGAEQYLSHGPEWPSIRYGYLEVEVLRAGEIVPRFREIALRSSARGSGPEPPALVTFCSEANGVRVGPDKPGPDCGDCSPK